MFRNSMRIFKPKLNITTLCKHGCSIIFADKIYVCYKTDLYTIMFVNLNHYKMITKMPFIRYEDSIHKILKNTKIPEALSLIKELETNVKTYNNVIKNNGNVCDFYTKTNENVVKKTEYIRDNYGVNILLVLDKAHHTYHNSKKYHVTIAYDINTNNIKVYRNSFIFGLSKICKNLETMQRTNNINGNIIEILNQFNGMERYNGYFSLYLWFLLMGSYVFICYL